MAHAPHERKAMPRWAWLTVVIVAAVIVIGAVIATYAVGGALF
jgi:hypothetical protein